MSFVPYLILSAEKKGGHVDPSSAVWNMEYAGFVPGLLFPRAFCGLALIADGPSLCEWLGGRSLGASPSPNWQGAILHV